jgi:hypothetical protein
LCAVAVACQSLKFCYHLNHESASENSSPTHQSLHFVTS